MEDVVDFFIPKCQVLGIMAEIFGICDDDDKAEKTPAYVSFDNEEKWGAIIKNYSGKPLNFTAVDNCVVVRRENDDMENRCDAMLSNADNLVFIELKNERLKWFPHAVKQLQKTIEVFKLYNDVSMYKRKRAFACNVRHPNFAYSNKEMKQKFYQTNGFRLYDEMTIEFR